MSEHERDSARQAESYPFVARSRSGDEAAFRELVRQHHSAMLGLARSFLHDLAHVSAILETLPPQRSIVMVRDIEDMTAEQTRSILGVSEANQRVLLHRGRSRIRHALETLLSKAGMEDTGDRPAAPASAMRKV